MPPDFEAFYLRHCRAIYRVCFAFLKNASPVQGEVARPSGRDGEVGVGFLCAPSWVHAKFDGLTSQSAPPTAPLKGSLIPAPGPRPGAFLCIPLKFY